MKITPILAFFLPIVPLRLDATLFEFTYAFQSGHRVVGKLEGEAGERFIENIRYGLEFDEEDNWTSYAPEWDFYASTGQMISSGWADWLWGDQFSSSSDEPRIPVDGGIDGLAFILDVDTGGPAHSFLVQSGWVRVSYFEGDSENYTQFFVSEQIQAERWNLSPRRTATVPDTGSSFLLMGLGCAAMVPAVRRILRRGIASQT